MLVIDLPLRNVQCVHSQLKASFCGDKRAVTLMTACHLRRCLLYAVLTTSIVLCVVLLSLPSLVQTAHNLIDAYACNEENSKLYLEELCDRYASGYITGSLCEPLCTTREIRAQKCIGAHRLKPFVIQAEWNSKLFILKTVRRLDPDRIMSSNLLSEMRDGMDVSHNSWSNKLTQEEFLKKARATVTKSIFVGDNTHAQSVVKLVSDSVAKECISKPHMSKDQKLRNIEVFNCWQLVASEEYIVTSLIQGKPHIPELKGVCGDLYAVEYVPTIASDQFLGFESVLSSQRSWNFRAKLALALLDMIDFAEETPYGTLHFCDVKETNFGVREQDGELVVKMIDLDYSWFGSVISSLTFEKWNFNWTCKHNSDCSYGACHVECDTTSGTCSNKLLSNNLQTLCERILTKPNFWQPSLLQNPPTTIKQQLETLLDQCINPKDVQTHIPKDLMRNIRTLLQSSIKP